MDTDTCTVTVRPAVPEDLPAVVGLDEATSGTAKPEYWREIFARHRFAPADTHCFLVAELDRRPVGFIIGEVRAWEFGSPPCGWVFAIDVDPVYRGAGIGTRLFDAISARFHSMGIRTLRTMVSRSQKTQLSFFRSQGLTTGPYIELETELD